MLILEHSSYPSYSLETTLHRNGWLPAIGRRVVVSTPHLQANHQKRLEFLMM
jgi:hypothetical protein